MLNVIVPPIRTPEGPEIAVTDGAVFTVATLVAMQPVLALNVIVDVPADTPVITPEAAPIVATDGLLLLHDVPVPAVTTLVPPMHKPVFPVMPPGNAFTVTFIARKQPVPKVYDIVGVPAAIPVTTPAALTVPNEGLLLPHVPPLVASVSVIEALIHTLAAPLIAAGNAVTVTITNVLYPE